MYRKLLIAFLFVFLLPVASAGQVGIYTKLCLDPQWAHIGQCTHDGGAVGGVTVTATNSLQGTTTDANGYGFLNVVGEGTSYINLTLAGYRNPGPTYDYVSTTSNFNGTQDFRIYYLYLLPVTCSPSDQTLNVPFYATWTYIIQTSNLQGFYTVFKSDAITSDLKVALNTNVLLNTFGTLHYPPGGLATQNGTNGQVLNQTGAYVVAFTDGDNNVMTSCTFELQTTGTTFTPISLTDPLNVTIMKAVSAQTVNIQTASGSATPDPVDFAALGASFIVGRPWFFPNIYYWIAGLVLVAFVVAPRRGTGDDSQ